MDLPCDADIMISPCNVLRRQAVGLILEMGASHLESTHDSTLSSVDGEFEYSEFRLGSVTHRDCIEALVHCNTEVVSPDGCCATTVCSTVSMVVHKFHAWKGVATSQTSLGVDSIPRQTSGHPMKVGSSRFVHLVDEMEVDMCLIWGNMSRLHNAWRGCDMMPHLACSLCNRLHHNSKCDEPNDVYLWIPRSTAVVDGLISSSGRILEYIMESDTAI